MNAMSLKDLCINYICRNIDQLYFARQSNEANFTSTEPEYMFIDRNAYLPMELSEILLAKLSSENRLNDEILTLFSHKNVHLRLVIFFSSTFHVSLEV